MDEPEVEVENELQYLDPGCDENPLEQPDRYNPSHHAYPLKVASKIGQLDVMVEFMLLDSGEFEICEFTFQGKQMRVPLFPKIEDGLLPDLGKDDERWTVYQIGETPYHVVPALVRCARDGVRMSREEAEELVTPENLFTALVNYSDQVHEDPNAPKALACLLDDLVGEHWEVASAEDDDEGWDDEEEEDEDELTEDEEDELDDWDELEEDEELEDEEEDEEE